MMIDPTVVPLILTCQMMIINPTVVPLILTDQMMTSPLNGGALLSPFNDLSASQYKRHGPGANFWSFFTLRWRKKKEISHSNLLQ